MALVYKDRVRVTSTITGLSVVTGMITVSGYRDFSFVGPSDTVPYTIVCADTSEWEVGLGTYAAGALTRVAVLTSSNANAPVSFGVGTKDVFCSIPADLTMTTHGGAFTGPVTTVSGASGSQVPQAREVPNLTFPPGTRMLFAQTTAPLGWVKNTSHNESTLRVVSGSAGSGGTFDFSSIFASRSLTGSVGGTVLAAWQMPSHTHVYTKWAGTQGTASGSVRYPLVQLSDTPTDTSSTGGNGAHNHSLVMTPLSMEVKYLDVIVAVKS